ncbi:DEKNAAC101932 [Brettanomyces naardenensis]|uniref:DEKNAAC101932 n=1 Tax=Brettanomyces naardenensis TaxID=13370 RepID=A0A448YJ80_BRENA|nr:DEKNAAC101932 [Brettanomyces naardenensis]
MRLLPLLSLASLCCAALTRDELDERASKSPNNVILVQEDEFEKVFDKEGGRDYFMVTVLTASHSESSCDLCKTVQPIFEEVAYTVGKKQPNSNIYFIHVDVHENLANMKNFGVRSVPQLWIYPPFELVYKGDDSDPYDSRILYPESINITSEHYEFPVSSEIPAKDLELSYAKFVSNVCQVDVHIDKGVEWQTLVKSFVAFTVVFRLIKKRSGSIASLLTDWKVYCCLFMALIYINLSGLNFCMQRAVPFLTRSRTGAIQWMAGGTQYQQGTEMIISIAFQATFSLILIVLLEGPVYLDGGNKGLAMSIAGVALFLLYNTFTTAYLAKDHEYPYNAFEMFSQTL